MLTTLKSQWLWVKAIIPAIDNNQHFILLYTRKNVVIVICNAEVLRIKIPFKIGGGCLP